MTKNKLNPKQQEQLIDSLRNGVPVAELMARYGLSKNGVAYYKDIEKSREKSIIRQRKWHAIKKVEQLEQTLVNTHNVFAKEYKSEILAECLALKQKLYPSGTYCGHYRKALLAAATHGLLRKRGEPYLLEEVADIFNVSATEVNQLCGKFYGTLSQPKPEAYIKRFANELNITDAGRDKALEFCSTYAHAKFLPHHLAIFFLHKAADIPTRELTSKLPITQYTLEKIEQTLKPKKQLDDICKTN